MVEGAEGLADVDKVVSADAVTVAANGVEAEGAGFTLVDGDLYLCVTFPVTADAKAISISQPADIELTFEEAKACAASGTWPLSGSVDVAVESGVAAEGDITWQDAEGFNAAATEAQELTAKGSVSRIVTADGDGVDDEGISHEVTCKIKIAAPAQGEDGGQAPAANNGGQASGKSALAKTGDPILPLAVAAVAVVAVAAIAVAIVAVRHRRS